MKVGIPREVSPGERRVAATPDTVKVLQEMGFEVQIEKGFVCKEEVPRTKDFRVKDRLQVCLQAMSFECQDSAANLHPTA